MTLDFYLIAGLLDRRRKLRIINRVCFISNRLDSNSNCPAGPLRNTMGEPLCKKQCCIATFVTVRPTMPLNIIRKISAETSTMKLMPDKAFCHASIAEFAEGKLLKRKCPKHISRNGPYIGGHLAFYFKLNFKQVYTVL